ncbi:MAG: Twinfilin-1 [Phylliscum demangeonii]|nr:MAG: Twinfilin-1 [Phylliscum demangeonii]
MQSGIAVSRELQQAFNDLVDSPNQRGILAGIEQEQLVFRQSLSSESADFFSDLPQLASLLKEHEAAYVLLRRYPDASDGFVAVTYVPDTAPVRQKMLFALSRMTLDPRKLGLERFCYTLSATTKDDLTADGFRRQERHEMDQAPLTQEEQALESVKQAEAEASRGTSARSGHVSSALSFPVSNDAAAALRTLPESNQNLVLLRIDVATETIELAAVAIVEPEQLGGAISASEPRYAFYRYGHDYEGQHLAPIAFLYTCPSGAKIKERMVYASSRAGVISYAEAEADLKIAKRLEASDPSEITAARLQQEFHPVKEERSQFSRPKRPGRK